MQFSFVVRSPSTEAEVSQVAAKKGASMPWGGATLVPTAAAEEDDCFCDHTKVMMVLIIVIVSS